MWVLFFLRLAAILTMAFLGERLIHRRKYRNRVPPVLNEEARLAQMLEDMSHLQSRADLKNIAITENNWFVHEAVYSGEGTADFQQPVEQAQGSFIARFDTDEGEAIDMDVAALDSPEDTQFDLSARFFNFLCRRVFSGNGSRDSRKCRVRFTTPDGSFTSANAFLQNAGGISAWAKTAYPCSFIR